MGAAGKDDRIQLSRPLTLGVDIGGTAIKALVIDAGAQPVGEHVVERTPQPGTPQNVVPALVAVAAGRDFDRVSIGFPGVIVEGTVHTAPNLDPSWAGFPLAQEMTRLLGKPARVCNDADLAGLGVVSGRGVEMVLTLGTGMGSALFLDGRLVPNLELGHHPFGDGRTYEERVANHVLAQIGEEAWRGRVIENIELTRRIWNWQRLYLGGGNARLFVGHELPPGITLVSNEAGVLSAVRLWA